MKFPGFSFRAPLILLALLAGMDARADDRFPPYDNTAEVEAE